MTSEPYYDPKMLELLIKGSQQIMTVENLDKNVAISLRHRLYRLRQRMRQHNHEETEMVNGAVIRLSPKEIEGEIVFDLMIYPLSLDIDNALKRAGVDILEPPPLDD